MSKFIYYLLVIYFFSGCESYNNITDRPPSVVGNISDNEAWYSDANNDLITFNVNIPTPNEYNCQPFDDLTAPTRPCTLEDINADTDPADSYEPLLHVNLSTQDFGSPTGVMNASFKIKGGYSRTNAQKAYSIKLDSKVNLLMKQRKWMLTKSQSDGSRMRNKLAFDMFSIIPNITSLKVQFINLKINGVDYGLYNSAEALRKEYLVNRGWNENDHIYNAVNFLFEEIPQLNLDEKGEPLDEVEFSKILEIKNGQDHSKLLEMVHAINTTTNIDTVVAKYFNRDNYITWLAINLILNNKDAIQHNFYLYNPVNSDTFYFLPWDYDGAWAHAEYLGRDEYGISVWWPSFLHRKFLSIQKNRDDVYALADTLREKYITDAFMQEKIAEYEPTVRAFQSQAPDNEHNSDTSWVKASTRLWSDIPENIAMYKSVIGSPMPFEQFYDDSTGTVSWSESVDLEGDEIVYDLDIVSSTDMNNSVLSVHDIAAYKYVITNLIDPGTYYLRVISKEKNDPTHYQICHDAKVKIDGLHYFGYTQIEVQ